jgi:alkaline phosphatase
MISVADHETGGITLPSGYNPSHLTSAIQSIDYLTNLWEEYSGSDRRGYLTEEILPAYGLSDISSSDIDSILSGSFGTRMAQLLSRRAGIAWGTGGHTAVDTTLYAYAVGEMGQQLKLDVAGSFDNTELPWYVAEALKVDMDEVTALLRENGTDWVPS